MMDGPMRSSNSRGRRGMDIGTTNELSNRRLPLAKNNKWVADTAGGKNGATTAARHGGDVNGRWERGGHSSSGGRVNGRKFPPARVPTSIIFGQEGGTMEEGAMEDGLDQQYDGGDADETDAGEPELETAEEREKYYQELVKAREVERKRAIAEGKMDDPLIPKRLDEAISIVGTCQDMCPRFERYRRERENNLFEWEVIPGTKRVDHKRAVKMYERAAGDKVIPSDLRPPHVLKRTLDYLFHDLILRGGFSQTYTFVRDRSRAVRNDFTMQHETGALAIECHDRCARFHILALHHERQRQDFSVALEEQQLMNTLQSLKEFYEDQRGRYQSPNELEMRVYHRLIHIRDQKERPEDIPSHITSHAVFQLTTKFRLHVQAKSAPIGRATPLIVDAAGMEIFNELVGVLRDEGNLVMIYLVACILERLFGPDTIDDIEAIRGDLSIPDIIDGVSDGPEHEPQQADMETAYEEDVATEEEDHASMPAAPKPAPLQPSATEWLGTNFGLKPTASAFFGVSPASVASAFAPLASAGDQLQPQKSAFSSLSTAPNAFGSKSVFGGTTSPSSVFGKSTSMPSSSPFSVGPSTSASPSPFGGPSAAIRVAASQPVHASAPPVTQQSPPSLKSSDSPFSTVVQPAAASHAFQPSSALSSSNIFDSPTSIPDAGLGTRTSALQKTPFQPQFSPVKRDALGFISTGKSQPQVTDPFASPSGPSPTGSSRPPINPNGRLDGRLQHSPLTPRSGVESHQAPIASGAIIESAQSTTSNRAPDGKLIGQPSTIVPPVSLPVLSGETQGQSRRPPAVSLSIDTGASFFPKPVSGSSPSTPQAPRVLPIPLPSTPRSSSFGVPSSKDALLDFPKSRLAAVQSSATGMLSPLFPSSPSPVKSSAASGSSTGLSGVPEPVQSASISISPVRINGKSKHLGPEIDGKAFEFLKRSVIVSSCFKRWRELTTDRAASEEAYYRSKAYRQAQCQTSPSKQTQRMSSEGSPPVTSNQGHNKRRVGNSHNPLTEEERVHRLEQNKVKHDRLWAPGTFLETIRACIRKDVPGWRIWLSSDPDADPDNERAAIWLQCKFSVPSSGNWVSDSIFDMPLSPQTTSNSHTSPGLIIFECTSLEHIDDDLKRKRTVLEDCIRLRAVLTSLPHHRAFIPSILFIVWQERGQAEIPADLTELATKLVDNGTIVEFEPFVVAWSKHDLDQRLSEVLASMSFDTEGQLVQTMSSADLCNLFISPWKKASARWIEDCYSNDSFNWTFYAHVLRTCVDLSNNIMQSVIALSGVVCDSNLFPLIQLAGVRDSESLVSSVLGWLTPTVLGDDAIIARVAADIQSQIDTVGEFPVVVFIDHVSSLVLHRIGQIIGQPPSDFLVSKTAMTSHVSHFEQAVQSFSEKLHRTMALLPRQSPSRRTRKTHSRDSRSPSPHHGAKRQRTSLSNTAKRDDELHLNGTNGGFSPSPTPSMSQSFTTNDESRAVTVAGLRALARDMLNQHGQTR